MAADRGHAGILRQRARQQDFGPSGSAQQTTRT
jgi:hypothetical protein